MNEMVKTYAGDQGEVAQAYYSVSEAKPTLYIGAASNQEEELAMTWAEWSIVFFSVGVFLLMLYMILRGMYRKAQRAFYRCVEEESLEWFRQYRDTWNRVAEECIEKRKECDELEERIEKYKDDDVKAECKPRSVEACPKHKSVQKPNKKNNKRRVISDEGDPCMPDNQEWGEW